MRTLRQLIACTRRTGDQPHGAPEPGTLRLLRDFFGHARRPDEGGITLSVLQQAGRLGLRRIHLNIILIGNDAFTDGDRARIENALVHLRDVMATGQIGIGRIERYGVSVADAGGYDTISGEDEAADLPDEWTVHNDGLDIFIVRTESWEFGDLPAALGQTVTDGPCNKDNTIEMSGLVIGRTGGAIDTRGAPLGNAIAHEIGHYLGCDHIIDYEDVDEATPQMELNVMWPGVLDGMVRFNQTQTWEMHEHCFVWSGC